MSARKAASGTEGLKQEKTETFEGKDAVRSEKDSKERTRIYIGPTIPGVAAGSQIFLNGIPDALTKAIQECPPIGKLLVRPEQLPGAMQELQKKDLVLDICYQQAMKYGKEKENGGL